MEPQPHPSEESPRSALLKHLFRAGRVPRRRWLLLFPALYVLLAVVFWQWGPSWLAALLAGQGPRFITDMLQYHQSLDPASRELTFYVELLQGAFLRLGLLLGVLSLWLGLGWSALQRRWQGFLSEPIGPQPLALFRILTFGTLLLYPNYGAILRMSALPAELLVAPPGLLGLLKLFPPTFFATQLLLAVFVAAATAALLGWKTRWMASLSFLTGLWVLGVPQFYGKINHYHHLLWFALLAAMAPVSEVWALDAKGSRVDGARHRAYLGVIVLTMGAVYFFPGWWKVLGGGGAWLWGDAVGWQLEVQALRLGTDLPGWAEQPLFSKIVGLGTVLFECSWWWWMLSKRARPWILTLGLGFHIGIYLLMDINFWVLPIFYLTFLPFERLWKADIHPAPFPAILSRSRISTWLLAAIIAVGFLHFDGWPLAVYPSFGNPPEEKVWLVSLEYAEGDSLKSVALGGRDEALRAWLPKTRLLGLHAQLTGDETKAAAKIRLLDPYYREALGLDITVARRYVKRKIEIETGKVLETRLLWTAATGAALE